eukprot:scaffold129187_cov43-Attheya_sp.AAC.1
MGSPFARCSGTFGAGIWLYFYDGWRYRGIWDKCADVSEFGGFLFEFLALPSYAWCSLATVRHLLINGACTAIVS